MIRDYQAIQKTWFMKGHQKKIPTYGKNAGVKIIGILDYVKLINEEVKPIPLHLYFIKAGNSSSPHIYISALNSPYPVLSFFPPNNGLHICGNIFLPF